MIKVENITYRVGNKIILESVSVIFEPGKLNLIIGPNGAGKSTLIKAICNQIQPDEGNIYYGDKNIKDCSHLELARIRSVLSQSIELSFPLKVWEVVMMGRYPHFTGSPNSKDETACEEVMRFFEVWDMVDRNYATLSGGEKQRVNFARVMAQIWYTSDNYRYLILDEPLTFLDIHYQFNLIRQLLHLLEDKKLIVVGVVHDLNLAAKFADKIVLLHEAKVLSIGEKQDVLSKENVKTAYRLEPIIYNEKGNYYLFFD
jgi:iron complex transport system ATP-binding protein